MGTHPSPTFPFSTVLIANRGEVAVRLVSAVQSLGLRAATVYVSCDQSAEHVVLADVSVPLGDNPTSYTDIALLLDAATACDAGAVLPGYGFLSENDAAVRAFESRGIVWCGPNASTIASFASKTEARNLARAAGIPIIPGSASVHDVPSALAAAHTVGFPALIKAALGGGGMGQCVAHGPTDVAHAFEVVYAQAEALFGGGDIFVERYVRHARHIEVQVFGDGSGKVVPLGLRECSVQRRRQKVVEEGPPTQIDIRLAAGIRDAAVTLCAAHKYRSAGTVEFIVDPNTKEWFFLEVNTRLQVEHAVTELTTGVDIVQWMLLLAGGVDVLGRQGEDPVENGCAIEARVYAENPVKDFAPSPGLLSEMIWPAEGVDEETGTIVRVDPWAMRGTVVTTFFDPLLGKVIVHGRTREMAIAGLKKALRATVARGVTTNVELVLQVLDHEDFVGGMYTTSLMSKFAIKSSNVEVITPGIQSSLQDYPGRVGYWDIGVSPSGAMDAYAMNVGNALVGNPIDACAIEMTFKGPTLKFHCDAVIALTGCRFHAEIDDGKPVPWWTPFHIEKGSVLELQRVIEDTEEYADDADIEPQFRVRNGGKIAYCAVRGGFDAPKYLGSASTFPTGNFGGVHGGFLKSGDFLPLKPGVLDGSDDGVMTTNSLYSGWSIGKQVSEWIIPTYKREEWIVGALNGPHGSEDFLQGESLTDIWTAPYQVHHAANRLGVRLIGPTPKWTRKDGGSAGLHPSNLHDYTYAPGAVNFSGNTPIVLSLDGPSLGGFVCPITVATSEMWKVSQATPGSTIRFKQIKYDDARFAISQMLAVWNAVRTEDTSALDSIRTSWTPDWVNQAHSVTLPAIVATLDPAKGDRAEIKVTYRMSGDEHILIEYGEIELDLAYRMRAHMLMEKLKELKFVKELCPGVRSVLVRFDSTVIHINDLIEVLTDLELGVLGSVENLVVPSRVLRLPLAFEDQWTIEAQQRYLRSVRPDAPYMPSNVEFVRRINGLASIHEVQNIMTSAEYIVLGLGDVYLGAPCAVPVDPSHRLVTSKYDPARTYTPEGAVGIGGAYMCIYGMDSPGGYQLMGRTIPIWDSYGSIPESHRGAPKHVPWLLQFFDRICYYPVSDEELETLRKEYRRGNLKLDIKHETFSYKQHLQFCKDNQKRIEDFRYKQQNAFKDERARWEESGEGERNAAAVHASRETAKPTDSNDTSDSEANIPYSVSVLAGVAATMWSVSVKQGDYVSHGQELFTLESMKVEISIEAPISGTVHRVRYKNGDNVGADAVLCIIASSQESAMSELSIGHLRAMYKLGVLTPGNVATALLSGTSAKTMFHLPATDAQVGEHATKIKRERGRRYLPLSGVPFVAAQDEVTKSLVASLVNSGAIFLGTLNKNVSPGDAVSAKMASFAVGTGEFAFAEKPGAFTLTTGQNIISGCEKPIKIAGNLPEDLRLVLRTLRGEGGSKEYPLVQDEAWLRGFNIGIVAASNTNVKYRDTLNALRRAGGGLREVPDPTSGGAVKEIWTLVDVVAVSVDDRNIDIWFERHAPLCAIELGGIPDAPASGVVLLAPAMNELLLLDVASRWAAAEK